MFKFNMIIISSLIYALSFIYIDYFWIGSLLFLYPLYRCIFFNSLHFSFKDGFVWGLVAYTIQTIAITDFVYRHGVKVWALVVPVLVIVIMSICSGIWFYIMNIIIKKNHNLRLYFIYISTIIFFYYIHYVVLIIFSGSLIGYPFSFPLLPLFYKSSFVQIMIWYGAEYIIFTIIIAIQLLFVFGWYKSVMGILILGVLGEFYIQIMDNEYIYHDDLCTAVVVNQDLSNKPYDRVMQLCTAISFTQYAKPKSRILVLPESVFPFYDESLHLFLASKISDYCHPDSFIVLGLYRKVDHKRFNSVVCIYKGKIIFIYDKKILVPFFEYIPSLFGDMMFAINGIDFSSGHLEKENTWQSSLYGSYNLMICAEVFWSKIKPRSVIIGCINDKYFKYSYFSKIMRIYADYRACASKSTIIYSAYN